MSGELAVVDASAMASLLFGEPRCEEVAGTLEGRELVVPTLLRYELGSVCLKKRELYPERRDSLMAAFSLLDRLSLREVAVEERAVIDLADQWDLTYYDASYLWLALELRAELITLDARSHFDVAVLHTD